MSSLRKKNLDEPINIPTRLKKDRSMTQISVRIQHEHEDGFNPEPAPKFTADPRSTVFAEIRSIYRKNPQSGRFLRPNPFIRKPIHPSCLRSSASADFTWHNNIYPKSGT